MRPKPERSFLIKAPTRLIAPNVPAVTKNVVAKLSAVYANMMNEQVAPFSMEYMANIMPATGNDRRIMLADKIQTTASSAINNPQK